MSSNYLSSLYREWEMILDSLSSRLVKDFVDIDKEYDSVQKVNNAPGICQIFTKWLANLNANDSSIALDKSKDLADKWRMKGNDFFKNDDLPNSLKYYNLSLLSAPFTDITFPLALANRSAVLVRMNKFKEALNDVQLALDNGYPVEKAHKLHERQQKCHSFIKASTNSQQVIAKRLSDLNIQDQLFNLENYDSPYECLSDNLLPYYKHSTIEGAVNILDLKYSDKSGRYVVAKDNVKRGDVLFVEKPYAFVALPGPNGVLPIVCENCGISCNFPNPCRECSGSIYCSESCREDAWSSFHKWECAGTRKLLWPTIGIAHLALRVLLVASKEKFGLNSNIIGDQSAFQILEEIRKSNSCPETVSGYHRVYNLLTNFDKMAAKDLLQYTLTSVMLTMYLKNHTNFFKHVTKDLRVSGKEIETVVSCLLLRQLGQMVSSGHALCGIVENAKGEEIRQTRFGTGIFPSASMMNHSCDSNIINNHYGSILVVRASRDILTDEEVFNCYGPSYKTAKGDERRALLRGQYLFDCQCSACSSKEKDNFIDVFNLFKCPNCFDSIVLDERKKMQVCQHCNEKIKFDKMENEFKKSLELYNEAIECKSNALEKMTSAYDMQQIYLNKNNAHLQRTMDALARCYAKEGYYDQSISILMQLIPVVEYQFGENSVEAGHELQKLSDVMMMELNSISDKDSRKFRDTLLCLQSTNKVVLDIFYIAYGPWTTIYKDAVERQKQISQFL